MSELLRGYNRSEREAIARSILLRAYSESFRHPNVHRRAALDVVIERPRERRTGRFSKSTSEKKKKMTNNTTVKKEARKSIFSLLDTLSTRAQTPPRRQRTRPRRTNQRSRPRTQRSSPRRKIIPSLSRPKTSHHTSTKKERKIRTRSPSKCFLGAGFKTKTRPPIGKLKPLAAVEPLTAWGSSDSPHFPRIFP